MKIKQVSKIPDYQSLMLPLLRLSEGGEISFRECLDKISNDLGLTEQERAQRIPSGKATVMYSRLQWAKAYLVQAKLIEITRRSYFQITSRGRQFLSDDPQKIDLVSLKQFAEFNEFRTRKKLIPTPQNENSNLLSTDKMTPEEQAESIFSTVQEALKVELLLYLVKNPPSLLEKLMLELLQAMGYGSSESLNAQWVGKSGDGGIDGIFNQDKLGLDTIYIQAKRYQSNNIIGPGEIRDFIGALASSGVNKGVFVTTSDFSPSARNSMKKIPQRIILINGEDLAELLIQYNVGIKIKESYAIKELDLSYFEDLRI